MNDYRYILEPYRGPASRYRCPSCNQPRKFTLYIDRESREPLADYVGRCDRESRCGYHYTPRQYFADNSTQSTQQRAASFCAPIMQAEPRPVDYLPGNLILESFKAHNQNNLFIFFAQQIGEAAAMAIFEKYAVGTSKKWPGATTFWQVDQMDRVHQCKVMLYDAATGRRVKKEGESFTAFMGKGLLGNYDANLQQCFFGCHLLSRYPSAPVAIVESEKTALYCSHYYPGLVWLATGGKQGCSLRSRAPIEPLKNRTVILFPDLAATKDWQDKARQIAEMIPCKIHVSTDLENMASEADKAAGLDIMDYHLQQQAAQYVTIKTRAKEPPPVPDTPPPSDLATIAAQFAHTGQFKPGKVSTASANNTAVISPAGANNSSFERTYLNQWDVAVLRQNIEAITLPAEPITLSDGTTITNAPLFANAHLQTIEANNGNPTFQPYYDRIIKFVEICKKQSFSNGIT